MTRGGEGEEALVATLVCLPPTPPAPASIQTLTCSRGRRPSPSQIRALRWTRRAEATATHGPSEASAMCGPSKVAATRVTSEPVTVTEAAPDPGNACARRSPCRRAGTAVVGSGCGSPGAVAPWSRCTGPFTTSASALPCVSLAVHRRRPLPCPLRRGRGIAWPPPPLPLPRTRNGARDPPHQPLCRRALPLLDLRSDMAAQGRHRHCCAGRCILPTFVALWSTLFEMGKTKVIAAYLRPLRVYKNCAGKAVASHFTEFGHQSGCRIHRHYGTFYAIRRVAQSFKIPTGVKR